MSCGISYSSSREAVQKYLCTRTHLPPNIKDPAYGSLTWEWGRAGGRCPTLDPEAKIPAWRFLPGRYAQITAGGVPLRSSDYLIRKSLMQDCKATSGVVQPPTAIMPPVMAAPDPVLPVSAPATVAPAPQRSAPMIVPRETMIPAPSAVQVSGAPDPMVLATGMGWKEAVVGAVGGFITGGPAGAITGAAAGYFGGGGETPSSPGTQPTGFGPTSITGGCPTGYHWDGTRCVKSGVGGFVERWLPGGATGVLPETQVGGEGAVMGAFGIPAMVPAQVGSTQYGPILRCPTGAVLGKDNLCYMKGSIPNKHRKWPKGPRPLLTGGEMKTLRKISSLENKVKRAWTAAGKPGQRTCRKR